MIVWSGKGLAPIVFWIIGMLIFTAFNGSLGDVENMSNWSMALSLLFAAGANGWFSKLCDNRDTLFFIQVKYWTWILAVMGVIGLAGGGQ